MGIILRILRYLKPYWKRIVVAYVALLIGMAMQLLVPRLVEYVIDSGLVQRSMFAVTLGSIAVVGTGILQAGFTYTRSYLFMMLGFAVSYDIRNEFYEHLHILPFSYFDSSNTGQLMSRATEDIRMIRRFLLSSMRSLVQSIIMLVVITIILLTIDWRLALISLACTPILAWAAVNFGRIIRPLFLAVQQQFGVMTNTLQENLSGARVVRSFAKEDEERERFNRDIQGLYDRFMATVNRSAWYFPFMGALSNVALGLILWYGGHQVANGNLSIGKLSAFYLYLAMLTPQIRMLGWTVNSIARAIACGERIFGVLDTEPDISTPVDPVPLPRIQGQIEFDHVSLRYQGARDFAVEDVSFTVEPGQRVALIGKPGAGKSSIINLIPRFYDVTAGSVRIDGIDVRDVDLLELRQQVGMVLQDTFLFATSIRENIAYGRPGISDDEIVAAAKAAHAHEFILTLENGYDTIIGERGVSLSGGQKQRVSLARAIAMDPRILILDDATSSVDTETDFQIQRALHRLIGGRTTFVIAHRLLTVKDADLILVMDRGRVVERGTHDSLLMNRGLYRELYDLQLRDQEEVAPAAD